MCVVTCGLVVDVESEGGREQVVRVRGDDDHPVTKGYCCVKGRGLDRMHHHPDALLKPMIRRGDELVESSWEACLDDVATRFERVVREFPEVLSVVTKTGRAEVATDPMGVELSDALVTLKPREQWTTATSDEELIERMSQRFASPV